MNLETIKFELREDGIGILTLNRPDNLNAMSIKSYKINNEMLIINDNILCVLIQKIKLKLLKKIIDRYYDKYNLFLILFDTNEYEKIFEIKELISLEKITILNKNEFYELNINSFT